VKRMSSLLFVTLILSAVAHSGQLTPEEKRNLELKPAVVMLQVSAKVDVRFAGEPLKLRSPYLTTGGSGFIIRSDGYIITSGIVVRNLRLEDLQIRSQLENDLAQKVYSQAFAAMDDYLLEHRRAPLTQNQKLMLFKSGQFSILYATPALEVYLANGRHFSGELVQYSGEFGTGADVAIVRIRGDNFPTVPVGDSDTVHVPDPVTVIGYSGFPLNDPLLAAITAGHISATQKLPDAVQEVFQSDAVTHFNGGGPVFNQNGQVIGIAVGGVRGTVVPINVAMQLLKSIGVVPDSGEFNRHWTRALDLYDARQCGASIEEFDNTLSFVPDLPDAQRLRSSMVECREGAGFSDNLLGSAALAWTLFGLIGLTIVLLGIVLIVRRYRTAKPSAIAGKLFRITVGVLDGAKTLFDFIPSYMSKGRDRMAIGMAVVAVMGAAAAYCAAKIEQDAVRLEAELDQGQMVQLSLLQGHEDARVSRHRLGDKAYAVLNTHHDPKADKWYAAFNGMSAFLNYIGGDQTGQSVSEQLNSLGYHTVWARSDNLAGDPLDIWLELRQEIRIEQHRLTQLVDSLAVFVLALVFLTLAQLSRENAEQKLRFTRLGCVTALAGLIYAGWHDPDSWTTFAWFAIVTPVLLFLGWILVASDDDWESIRTSSKLGAYILGLENRVPPFTVLFRMVKRIAEWLRKYLQIEDKPPKDEPSELDELDRPRHPGLRIPVAPVSHRFGRTVVYFIAGTAFLSALYGLTYSRIIIRSDRFGSQAFDSQVRRSDTVSHRRADAVMHLEELISVWECQKPGRTNQENAETVRQNPAGNSSDQANSEMAYRLDRCQGITPQKADVLATELSGSQGPDQDPEFPKQLLLPTLLKESEMLFAKADGEKEISFGWRRRATPFLLSLTLFAISLYLLGQAIGLGATRSGFMLLFYAAALALGGAVSPLVLGWHYYRFPDERKVLSAAEDYAAGRTFYETHKCKEATDAFQAAYIERPTFYLARNYLYLAGRCRDLEAHAK
jgi:serine protease Do